LRQLSVCTKGLSASDGERTRHKFGGQAVRIEDAEQEPPGARPAPEAGGLEDEDQGAWARLPSRTRIVVASGGAFMFSNLDKVILSIAIIPMSMDLDLSPTISGVIQSSFFWGYILVQLPGGYLVSRFGGRRVLPAGVAVWSIATAALPLSAQALPALCLSRALVGLGEGLAPPSSTELIARVVPESERSGSIAKVFSGLHVGSIAALLAGPGLIKAFGWQSVFYLFGGAGLVWCLWWEKLLGATYDEGTPQREKEQVDRQRGRAAAAAEGPAEQLPEGGESLPWRAFLREPAVLGLMYVHFCNNWFHYTMLAWLPTFYIQTLELDLGSASGLSLLPPLAAFACSNLAGPAADALISSGTPVVLVRKFMQGFAFVAPSILLAGAASFSDDTVARVSCITLALGLNSFTMAGLYSNHADLSPKYCSVLLGLTNTTGAIPGIIGVTFTGMVLEKTNDWNFALFSPCIFFFLTGFVTYMITGSSDRKEFNNNEPFEFESVFSGIFRRKTD